MKQVRVKFKQDWLNGIPAGAEQTFHEVHAKPLIEAGIAEEIPNDRPGSGKHCETCGGEQDIAEETAKAGKAKAGRKNTITKDSIE